MARPTGFVFLPSDHDLVWYFLVPKVLGRRIPNEAAVTETDIYRFDPDNLTFTIAWMTNYAMILVEFDGVGSFTFVLDSKLHSKRMCAGICSLVSLNPNISFALVVSHAVSNRNSDGKWDYFFVRRDLSERSRRTPNGFWKEVGKVETINAAFLGGVIAFKRSFVFVEGTEADPGAITRWEMAEYRLNRERHLLRNDDDPEMNNYVACRVYLEAEPISECTVDSAYRQNAEEEDDEDDENTEVDSSEVRK
ncbi:No apical meristem (NAM) protein [Musa troglodytarum]|uniref:No apical meristem (NAM) protein n=1 Tax=Musa troglodytarum TaxID=320322 RepID=A0A9E7FEZ9_9LILI|nr:No apical meristem (NAM) protein [Musa troglodytarum]